MNKQTAVEVLFYRKVGLVQYCCKRRREEIALMCYQIFGTSDTS